MLQCYIDESGTGDSPVMVMAGLVSDPVSWARFSVDWQECLDMRPRMDALHMRDIAESWGDETQERVARFRKILCQHAMGSVIVSMPLQDYREIFGSKIPWNNPYIFLFFVFIRAYKKSHAHLGLGREIEFIFDEQTGALTRVAEAWEFFRQNSHEILDFIGGVPSFRDDKQVLPLQAADLVAWWIRRQIASDMLGVERLETPWEGTDAIPCLRLKYDREALLREHNQMF